MSILQTMYSNKIDRDIRFVLFNAYVVITALLSLIFMFIHIINRRPLSNILTAAFIFLISGAWYLLSNRWGKYVIARRSYLIFMTFIYVPFGYWTSPGSTSAMLYLVILVIFMLSFVAVDRWEYLFPLIVLIEAVVLMQTEIWFADHYYVYTDTAYRIWDITTNYVVIVMAVMGTIHYVMRQFKKHNDQLYTLSITDGLTGLYNRRYFGDFVTTEYNRAVRTEEPFSLVFIDLNNFKRINDIYGHLEGDKVLKDIAEIIIHNIRNYDIAARYGGDEFIIILPKTDEISARHNIERMNEMFADYSRKYTDTDFSVGFGVADSKGKSLDEIFRLADDSLYQKKSEQKKAVETGV